MGQGAGPEAWRRAERVLPPAARALRGDRRSDRPGDGFDPGASPQGILTATLDGGYQSIARRIPVGVIGIITPWNSPLILGARAIGPALAMGNAVILKPDVQTPVAGGVSFARLLEEAGLPNGLFHVLPGGPETGAALVKEPLTNMISFTGSTRVGRQVGSIASGQLKRVILELGGNNPYIVLDDADIEAAASAGAWGAFFHQGQICLTGGPPIRQMLELGLGAGTDATRVASYNPFVALYWLTSGKPIGGLALYPDENRLERMEALRLFTVGSSWFSSEKGKKGSIVPGQLADLAVLSADYFSIPEDEIKRLESVLTIVGGKVVYAAVSFERYSPPQLPVSPDWSPVSRYGGYARSTPPAQQSTAIISAEFARAQNRAPGHGTRSPWWFGCGCFV